MPVVCPIHLLSLIILQHRLYSQKEHSSSGGFPKEVCLLAMYNFSSTNLSKISRLFDNTEFLRDVTFGRQIKDAAV